MKALNSLVMGLIILLAVVLLLVANSSEWVGVLSDYSVLMLFAVGIVGLVGAREKIA